MAPRETASILKKAGIKYIHELNWWEEISINGMRIISLPSLHWSKRFFEWKGGWNSYLFEMDGVKIYFAGDTAYGSHFAEIGRMFRLHLSFLPVGAYRPSFIMKRFHMNPDEAMKAFLDLNAKFFIPIHWGAYRVALEGEREPVEKLRRHPLFDPGRIFILEPGEMMEFSF